jgi:hypothetical protein
MRWGLALARPFHERLPMNHDQFTLPFLDTTAPSGSLGLYGAFPTTKSSAHTHMDFAPDEPEALDAPIPTKPSVPALDYRLAGDRRLAESWKGRAEDDLAAIRLMVAIEADGRHAHACEQERLARFTGFGATDLADKLFRRAGQRFAPAWEDLRRPIRRNPRMGHAVGRTASCFTRRT